MSENTEPNAEQESPFERVAWAAQKMDVSQRHAYRLIKRGEIPGARHFGAATRIHRETFLAWLEEGFTA